jgi:phosphomethylpyrimidine synthase
MCGRKFCSMEITRQVRVHAAELAEKEPLSSSDLPSPAEAGFAKAGAVEQARKQGMAELSAKFRASGAEVYVEPSEPAR